MVPSYPLKKNVKLQHNFFFFRIAVKSTWDFRNLSFLNWSVTQPICFPTGSLSALVYQHSVLPLALPTRLTLPSSSDPSLPLSPSSSPSPSSSQLLLAQGAACNVLYLVSVDTESLTGPSAVSRAIGELFNTQPLPHAAVVHFKVSSQGKLSVLKNCTYV